MALVNVKCFPRAFFDAFLNPCLILFSEQTYETKLRLITEIISLYKQTPLYKQNYKPVRNHQTATTTDSVASDDRWW